MPFTAPVVVTIPAGQSVVYIEHRRARPYHRGVLVRARDLLISWRGAEEEIFVDLGHKACRWKGVIADASPVITIAAWHDNCGRSPRVTLSAAGATRALRVGVRLSWSEGPPALPILLGAR